MSDDNTNDARGAAEGVLKMADELEASGDATFGGDALENARAVLHQWVDTVTAVVSTPAFGRVTLIHKNGRQSSISSSDLPFQISVPVDWKKEG